MSAEAETALAEFQAIVGAEHIRAATQADAIDGIAPQVVVEPGSAKEAVRLLMRADEAGLKVAPRGGGTKLAWGNPPRKLDVVLSTLRLNRVVEHAWGDMTATVEAGCTVARFQEVLAEHGQRLALDPLWPAQATIGGILAANDSGSLRVRFGGLRDLVLGVTVALPNGTLARSGGKVVKNVAGYDLPKLLTGSLGTLGLITQATFRLYPLPRAELTLSATLPTSAAMSQFMLAVLDSTLVPTGLQLRARGGAPPEIDLRFEGVEATIERQVSQLRQMGGSRDLREASDEVWGARERLWQGAEPALVCKVSVLPSELGGLCDRVERIAESLQITWQLVAQATGLGMLRLEGANDEALLSALATLRPQLEREGGSLVALHCPAGVKARIDVWGDGGDALPLMRRVKEQFDPSGTLNPGRFIGGI